MIYFKWGFEVDKNKFLKKLKPDELAYCLYISKKNLKMLKNLMSEVDGVYKAENIKHIHRVRVATRRIRSALAVFECCCKTKQLEKWRKEIRDVTRRLGKARDLDVKAEFLKDIISSIDEDVSDDYLVVRIGKIKNIDEICKPSGQKYIRPGLDYMLMRIEQGRKALQPKVVDAMDGFLESGVTSEMTEFCNMIEQGADVSVDYLKQYCSEKAAKYMVKRIRKLYEYQPFVNCLEKTEEHHEMRIAAKKLRYTMELFDELYTEEFRDLTNKVKRLQELLGDMHDCDVWLEYLPEFALRERRKAHEFFGNDVFFKYVETGIDYLNHWQTKKRKELYESFVDFWNDYFEKRFREDVEQIINCKL